MFFSKRLPLSALIELCRALRHYLGAGLTLRDVFRQQADRGAAAVRPVAARIRLDLETGDDLETALKKEEAAFPPLFVSLTTVGERTGNLPEVCHELEEYYTMQQKLRREFIAQSTWPVLQFVGAIFVIAAMLCILGLIAEGKNTKPLDPLGFGLTGPSGAIIFLTISFGTIAAVIVGYILAVRFLKMQAAASIDRFLLSLPAIGPCLEALAMTRFCLALRLTMETAMSITKAVALSLKATGNHAFFFRTSAVKESLRAGKDLSLALANVQHFPSDFKDILAVGEESGRVVEVLRHQAKYYQEEAVRRMKVLTRVAAFAVWLFTAVLIVWTIFRIFGTYVGAIQSVA